jgi:hypothetical protein
MLQFILVIFNSEYSIVAHGVQYIIDPDWCGGLTTKKFINNRDGPQLYTADFFLVFFQPIGWWNLIADSTWLRLN